MFFENEVTVKVINRISDGFSLSDEAFEQLAKKLSGNNGMKFHSITASKEEAKNICSELKSNGLISKIDECNGLYKIYYTDSKLKVASNIDYFTSVGKNLFRVNEKIAGVYDYDFDDGAIWEVKHFDDGDYLVKTIQSNDENDVVRIKTADLNNQIVSILKQNNFIVSEPLLDELKEIIASKNIINHNDLEKEIKNYCSKVV